MRNDSRNHPNSSYSCSISGGIRTMKDIEEALNDGLNRVILGTSAVKEKDLLSRL